MNNDIKKLHDLGFAIHWLKPKSKRPVESGWTKGPRKTWDELKATYSKGYNVGVRLGTASKIKGLGYLAVIDCDVKSTDMRHLAEMHKKLYNEFDLDGAPQVLSGRGNGSKHYYVLTKKPLKPFRLSQSKDKVKVHMPSVKPSSYELEHLSDAELKGGMRFRAAWEIAIMSEGNQVVLPPSVHPDSGKRYTWLDTGAKEKVFPLLEFDSKAVKEPEKQTLSDFKPYDVDLVSSNLPNHIVDLILSGKGCEDRSASLFTVSIAMLKEGFSDNEILTVLTDRETFLGACPYDHTHQSSRQVAADWVFKFTLLKAKETISIDRDFESAVSDVVLDEKAARKQTAEIVTPLTWEAKLDRTSVESGAKVKPTFTNLIAILSNKAAPNIFIRDDFANADLYGVDGPWFEARKGKEFSDSDALQIKAWIGSKFKLDYSVERIHEAVTVIACNNRFHPVRDYLESLEWDGVPRIDTWLKDYMEAKGPEPYLSAVSRKVLCAMVARVMDPGCKFDQVLILEGDQGVGKSTALRILAEPWYSDAPFNVGDKDAVVGLRSVWLLEIGELSGMRKADADLMKAFISQQADRVRVPYGRRTENFPRQSVFIGTTNQIEYLKDTTGNRRFWPVQVGKCDFKGLKKAKQQLFAEAYFQYMNLEEKLYLTPKESAQAVRVQSDKMHEDPWVEKIENFLFSKPENFDVKRFKLSDLFGDFGACFEGGKGGLMDTRSYMRAAQILRNLGYRKIRVFEKDRQYWFWIAPDYLAPK